MFFITLILMHMYIYGYFYTNIIAMLCMWCKLLMLYIPLCKGKGRRYFAGGGARKARLEHTAHAQIITAEAPCPSGQHNACSTQRSIAGSLIERREREREANQRVMVEKEELRRGCANCWRVVFIILNILFFVSCLTSKFILQLAS